MNQALFEAVLQIVVAVVTAAIGIGGSYLLAKLGQKKGLETTTAATEAVIAATIQTVHALQQTIVIDWKERSGKLTPAQIESLKKKVIRQTKDKLSKPVKDMIAAAGIDIAAMITSAAEDEIYRMKDENGESEDWAKPKKVVVRIARGE